MFFFDIIDRRILYECIKIMCFFLVGVFWFFGGIKVFFLELDIENGCGIGFKCDYKCILYDGVF